VPVDTHTGTGALMGLAPKDATLLARGPVEAAGIGLPVGPGDVLLRCNFATLSSEQGKIQIADRRAGRIREGTDELASVLRDLPLGDGITGGLYPTTQHRAVLALRGLGLSADVTDTDPGSGREAIGVLPASAHDGTNAAAQRTADAINQFVHDAQRLLAAHPINAERIARGLLPANGILTRSAGVAGSPRSLVSHLGLNASVITGEQTVAGLGRLFGFRIISEAGFTAMPQTDLAGKLAAAASELETSDLVFLHIKGPDICSHDRDPLGKKANLERIDASLSDLKRDDLVIGVTGDHSSDSNRGRHCGDPVPSLLVVPAGRCDISRGSTKRPVWAAVLAVFLLRLSSLACSMGWRRLKTIVLPTGTL
jgi:2,3-bisphosphoglycerate-independent phosphoglycerate mutase